MPSFSLNLRRAPTFLFWILGDQPGTRPVDSVAVNKGAQLVELYIHHTTSPVLQITSNDWTSELLLVKGILNRPIDSSTEYNFIGYDANQHEVARSESYDDHSDGTILVALHDPNRQIRYVKVIVVDKNPNSYGHNPQDYEAVIRKAALEAYEKLNGHPYKQGDE